MDLALAKNKIKIKKGEKPEAEYEAIINVMHEDEIAIGKNLPVKMGGHKLTVVGYYTSDSADDDTYYVNSDTVRVDYISKQKDFTAYTDNTALLKSMLSKEGLSAKENDVRAKRAYISSRKAQLTSAIIVAGIIMFI